LEKEKAKPWWKKQENLGETDSRFEQGLEKGGAAN